jgi:hypothetical protein
MDNYRLDGSTVQGGTVPKGKIELVIIGYGVNVEIRTPYHIPDLTPYQPVTPNSIQ